MIKFRLESDITVVRIIALIELKMTRDLQSKVIRLENKIGVENKRKSMINFYIENELERAKVAMPLVKTFYGLDQLNSGYTTPENAGMCEVEVDMQFVVFRVNTCTNQIEKSSHTAMSRLCDSRQRVRAIVLAQTYVDNQFA